MRDVILNFLKEKKDEFITSELIARVVNVSIDEVEKKIEHLKSLGYQIEFIPHRGIRLVDAPSGLLPYEIKHNLNTEIVGREVFCYDEITSTNDKAKELAIKSDLEGIVVLAKSQTRGRGRMHRQWKSPEGGLYLSIVLRPKKALKENAKSYLLFSVAVCEVLREVARVNSLIKWPNDIMINHKKVAGILTESSIYKKKLEFLIAGIGINVNSNSANLPEGSTSLLDETQRIYSLIDLSKEILRRLDKYYLLCQREGVRFAVKRWRGLSSYLGSRIKILNKDEILEGMAVGIDEDSGALLLREDNGFVKPILSIDTLTVEKT